MSTATYERIPKRLERGISGYPCSCGGYCEITATSEEEERECGCGRPGCCAIAFACRICGKRYAGRIGPWCGMK